MSKELIIDKNTNIKNITDKSTYEKLTLKYKINPKKLKEFTNIKELTIDYVEKNGNNYNEKNINLLPFKDKIEKLIFKKVRKYGEIKTYRDFTFYCFELTNLKSIEFPTNISDINSDYLEKFSNLEELIFNVDDSEKVYIGSNTININSDKFKRIIIKYNGKDHVIESDYLIEHFYDIDIIDNILKIEFSNDDIETEVSIENDEIKIENATEIASHDHEIYIPDYTTNLYSYTTIAVSKISLNLELLNHVSDHDEFTTNCKELKVIELRSSNEMSLIPNKIINVNDYGELLNLNISNNLLCLEYKNFTITVNSKGVINRNYKITENTMDTLDLKGFSVDELEYMACYFKLLKLSKSNEYKEAMKVIEKTLIKKYKRF